jgi:CRISPR-associated endonuclease/helicase Cas3
MDISAEQLHTELAPMNALIQRAGRTARYEDRAVGDVTVYEPAGVAPYGDADQAELLNDTRVRLRTLPSEGRVVDFAEERTWVESVHSLPEERELRRYASLNNRRDAVHRAMDEGERGLLSDLVRNIDSLSVLITSDPDAHFGGGGWPRLLSVPSISLLRLRECFSNLTSGEWVAKGAREDDQDERPGLRLKWEVLTEKQLRGQWLVAIHPDFASYNERIGLRLAEGGPEPQGVVSAAAKRQSYSYEFEPWVDHSRRVVARARQMDPAYFHSTRLLARKYGVAERGVKELLDAVCAFHDVGKLAEDWQKVAWKWQDDKDARARAAGATVPIRSRAPIAHTWYEPEVDWRLKSKYPFPPHAVQGAFAVDFEFVDQSAAPGDGLMFESVAQVAITAIARHHGAHTRSCTEFRLVAGAGRLVSDVLGLPLSASGLQECTTPLSRYDFPRRLLTFSRDRDGWLFPLYSFLVRRLRLADQAATGNLAIA